MDYNNSITININFYNMILELLHRHVQNPPLINAHIFHNETIIMEKNLYYTVIGLLNRYIVDDDRNFDTEFSEAETLVDDSD